MIHLKVIIRGAEVDREKTMASVTAALQRADQHQFHTTVDEMNQPALRREDFENADVEAIHIIEAGDIVLPDFYSAMLTTLEASRRDYVVCSAMRFEDGNVKISEALQSDLLPMQVIFRKWILEELENPPLPETIKVMVQEYCGSDVPHVLCLHG